MLPDGLNGQLRAPVRLRWLPIVSWVAVVSVLTLPSAVLAIDEWLDGSWRAASQMLSRAGVPLGGHTLFTYGPYGFLDVRTPFLAEQWLEGIAVGLVVHALLVATVAAVLWRRRASWRLWIAGALPALVALPLLTSMDTELDLLTVLFAYFAIVVRANRVRVIACTGTGGLLGFALLVKGTGIAIVAGVLLVTLSALLLQRNWRAALVLAGGFVASANGLWWIAGLGPSDMLTYLRGSFELGVGYSAAMYRDASPWPATSGAILLMLAAGVAGYFAWKKRAALAAWFLLVLVVGFAFFKDNFIRGGPYRYSIFCVEAAFLVALSLMVVARRMNQRQELTRLVVPAMGLTAAVSVVLTLLGVAVYSLDGLPGRWSTYGTAFSALVDPAHRTALEADLKTAAQQHYASLIRELNLPTTATVEAMPWDAALFYADPQLRWDPRPVLQSYTAYTPWLDQRDAAFFAGPGAPEYVVYTYESLDGRYEAFDEPATFRTLLQHYAIDKVLDTHTVLLRHRDAVDSAERDQGRACAVLGQPIRVPQLPGRSIFAAVGVQPTLAGRVLDLIDRPSAVAITLTTSTTSRVFRLIPAVAADGLYVSSLFDSAGSVGETFNGLAGEAITSLTVSTVRSLDWHTPVCVTFTSTPIPTPGATMPAH
jgi:hypothetical protein